LELTLAFDRAAVTTEPLLRLVGKPNLFVRSLDEAANYMRARMGAPRYNDRQDF